MWKAFLAETGADLTITCETLTDENDDAIEVDDITDQESRQAPARTTFRVQKGILISRSEIFAAMFSHGFAEGETGNLHISDMSPQVPFHFLNLFRYKVIFFIVRGPNILSIVF